ncbi:MAG: tRNA-dihydrouridine synthase family protein [Patescibacteria group bacterium]
MENSFWKKLKKPFFCLAPLADVTDPAFRRIIAKYGKPDVLWTEFVSADGLFRGGYDALIGDLDYTEEERPILAQFFSREPEYMVKAAELAISMGFDGIDINMGCPDENVCKQGAGAAIIKDPERAKEIIRATQEAISKSKRPIPLSIKTRIGYNTNEIETWLPALLQTKPSAITVHGRTKKEMSKVPARWDVIARAVEIRNEIAPEVLIIGNGDVKDLDDAHAKVKESKCDGIMLGRAIFGNPWLFGGVPRPDLPERLRVLVEHIMLFDELLSKRKSFATMKKHFKSYVHGEGGNKSLVMALMETKTPAEALEVIKNFPK